MQEGTNHGQTRPVAMSLSEYWGVTGRPLNYKTPQGTLTYKPAVPTKSNFGKFANGLVNHDTIIPYPEMVAAAHIQLGLMPLPSYYGSHVLTHNHPIRSVIQRYHLPTKANIPYMTLSPQTIYQESHNRVPPYILKSLALATVHSVASAALALYSSKNPDFKGFDTPRKPTASPPVVGDTNSRNNTAPFPPKYLKLYLRQTVLP